MAGPEERRIYRIGVKFFVMAGKLPDFAALLIKIVPPAQPDKKSACDIFDRPEVESTEDDHDDEGVNVREEITENEIAE